MRLQSLQETIVNTAVEIETIEEILVVKAVLTVAATVAVLVKNLSTAIENLRRAAVQPVVRR